MLAAMNPTPSKSIRRVRIIAQANAAFLLLVIALERFPGERWWPTLLLTYSPQVIWAIPSVAILACALVRRQWLSAAGTAALVGIVAVALMGIPIPRNPPGGTSDFRVLTWNLYHGRGGDALPELAQTVWPDVVCLQEANPWAGEGIPMILNLPQFAGWHSKICGELVILSRFPLKRLGTTHSALWVSANVDGREVVIVNAHLAVPFVPGAMMLSPGRLYEADRLRQKQMSEILTGLPEDYLVVVCGDFNTPPNTRIYRSLRSRLINSFERSGRGTGLTFLKRLPLVRIDHIFVSDAMEPVRCWTPRAGASNHRPLCADIRILRPAAPAL